MQEKEQFKKILLFLYQVIYENDDSLLLFRKLCKNYFSINPIVTARYINYYKEQNDLEGLKFENKVETKVKEES